MNNCSKCGNLFIETSASFGECQRCRNLQYSNYISGGKVCTNERCKFILKGDAQSCWVCGWLQYEPELVNHVRETIEDYLL